jgi:hypothetical protein
MVFINRFLLSNFVPLSLLWQEVVIVCVGCHLYSFCESLSMLLERGVLETAIDIEAWTDVDRAG